MTTSGRVAVVTGGGSGIGAAVARALAGNGTRVVITGRREDKLREVSASTRDDGFLLTFACDVSDRSQICQLMEFVEVHAGPIDILVNNAGINVPRRRLSEISFQDWDRIMDINVTGAFNLIQAVLPGMRARKDGLIISISSIAGIRASEVGGAAYSASKHALTALTKLVSLEERGHGIRATVIYPGEVETPLLDERPVKSTLEQRAVMLQPEDIAAAVVFIATLPSRANIPEMVIKPTVQPFA